MSTVSGATVYAEKALLADGWAENVAVSIGSDGRIASVERDAQPIGERVGILLPAPVNLHSHAFQRAMAGMSERRGSESRDSFWTWRQIMFRFLDALTPEDVEAIAAFVQMEMLEAGYAAVGEFHYLHHQPGGASYANLAEMSDRIMAAAADTGIGLTHLPVHYQFGGCDGRPLAAGQIRFGNDFDRFQKLHELASEALKSLPDDAVIGVAPHSLRAVDADSLKKAVALAGGNPLHMHLAEQIPEVDEVLAATGQRPVEWLLANHAVSENWCLIHCTQMTSQETAGLAATGAVAGLCPITESSLGDGIFDGVDYLAAGGRFGVGSIPTSASRSPKSCARWNIPSACAIPAVLLLQRRRSPLAGSSSTASWPVVRRRRGVRRAGYRKDRLPISSRWMGPPSTWKAGKATKFWMPGSLPVTTGWSRRSGPPAGMLFPAETM